MQTLTTLAVLASDSDHHHWWIVFPILWALLLGALIVLLWRRGRRYPPDGGDSPKRILGERCPVCRKVYVPPRGSCPTDGVPTSEQVELAHTGIVTTFCVVNVQFYGQAMELPYVCATVLLAESVSLPPAPIP